MIASVDLSQGIPAVDMLITFKNSIGKIVAGAVLRSLRPDVTTLWKLGFTIKLELCLSWNYPVSWPLPPHERIVLLMREGIKITTAFTTQADRVMALWYRSQPGGSPSCMTSLFLFGF